MTDFTDETALSKGIFWIICNFVDWNGEISIDLSEYRLLYISVPCNENGEVESSYAIQSNSKKGDSFNHKITWESGLFGNVEFSKLVRQHPYNYYPRGRVEISNRKVIIYLNRNINTDTIIGEIKSKFGLNSNLKSLKIKVDNSQHYYCYADGL